MTPDEMARADQELSASPDYWVGRLAMLCALCLDERITSGQVRRYLRATLAEFMVSPVSTTDLRDQLRRHL